MIIGFSGAGKSTLAKIIADKIDCEATHLDSLHWLPNWVENTPENERTLLASVLENEKWVIDGNYSKVLYNERMNDADTIIFLDFNRFLCLYRVSKRYFKYRGKNRPDMGEGCDEKLDFEFLSWVLHRGRKSKMRKKRLKQLKQLETEQPEKNIYILRTPKQVERFLKRRIDI